MQYVDFGRTGLRVSRLGFGGIPVQRIDEPGTRAMLKAAHEAGINYIDTARAYTVSEEWIGQALEELINLRETRCCTVKDKEFIPISTQESENFTAQVICPIITEGDAIGAVIITSRIESLKMGEVEQKLALAAASFLGRQLEQ